MTVYALPSHDGDRWLGHGSPESSGLVALAREDQGGPQTKLSCSPGTASEVGPANQVGTRKIPCNLWQALVQDSSV